MHVCLCMRMHVHVRVLGRDEGARSAICMWEDRECKEIDSRGKEQRKRSNKTVHSLKRLDSMELQQQLHV